MKFIVDEMPYWSTDCPFYSLHRGDCKLSDEHCRYFDRPAGDREADECEYLEAQTNDRA